VQPHRLPRGHGFFHLEWQHGAGGACQQLFPSQPGPFARLDKLDYEKQIIVDAWGQQYVYELRSVYQQVSPNDMRLFSRHEERSWQMLITCRGYKKRHFPTTGAPWSGQSWWQSSHKHKGGKNF